MIDRWHEKFRSHLWPFDLALDREGNPPAFSIRASRSPQVDASHRLQQLRRAIRWQAVDAPPAIVAHPRCQTHGHPSTPAPHSARHPQRARNFPRFHSFFIGIHKQPWNHPCPVSYWLKTNRPSPIRSSMRSERMFRSDPCPHRRGRARCREARTLRFRHPRHRLPDMTASTSAAACGKFHSIPVLFLTARDSEGIDPRPRARRR